MQWVERRIRAEEVRNASDGSQDDARGRRRHKTKEDFLNYTSYEPINLYSNAY